MFGLRKIRCTREQPSGARPSCVTRTLRRSKTSLFGRRLFPIQVAFLLFLATGALTRLHTAPREVHDWQGELALVGSLNSAGLALELELVRRFDISDPSVWLASNAHIGVGTFISLYPVGYHAALRVVVSPLLFLDAGIHAGLHGSWEMYRYDQLPARYGENDRDGLSPSVENMAWISPFVALKAKFGGLILYNSFWFERYFGLDGWWMNWYHDAIMRDGWLVNVNNYLMYEFPSGWRVGVFSKYWYTWDARETKWLLGIGPSALFGDGIRCTLGLGWHVREVNYDGLRLMASVSVPLAW